MSIKLTKEREKQLIKSIIQYFEEHMEREIGELKAMLLLDYFLKEIGPSIYNKAILDAQTFILEKVNDLESSCYEPEFMYWKNEHNKSER